MSPISTISTPGTSHLQNAWNIQSKKLEQLGNSAGVPSPSTTSPTFGKALDSFIQDVDSQIKVSNTERNKVISGETTNLHQAMIASQEASIGFTFMVELRNKLVESYQELMRSQI